MEKIDDWIPEVVVLAAGDYPRHALPLSLLRKAEKVVCCDSAADAYMRNEGRLPWRVVGDGDSLSTEGHRSVADRWIHVSEQESNDLTKAVRYLCQQGFRKVAILGATGKREDHTLGNIALLADYVLQGLEVRMYTDFGVFVCPSLVRDVQPVRRALEVQTPVGTQVSIFLCGATSLQAEGLKYPVRDFTSWWQGTLNEAVAPVFRVSARGMFLVFLSYAD